MTPTTPPRLATTAPGDTPAVALARLAELRARVARLDGRVAGRFEGSAVDNAHTARHGADVLFPDVARQAVHHLDTPGITDVMRRIQRRSSSTAGSEPRTLTTVRNEAARRDCAQRTGGRR